MSVGDVAIDRIHDRLTSLRERRAACWKMAEAYLVNLDHHGMHDMGVEIAALDFVIAELTAVLA